MKDISEKINISDLWNSFIEKNFNVYTIIFCVYFLLITTIIIKIRYKKLIIFALSLCIITAIYFIISDITAVHYLLSLHINENFRLIVRHFLPSFSISKHAPSKALPTIQETHFIILKIQWINSPIYKAIYEYSLLVQKRLLFIAHIYILILDVPIRKYILKTGSLIKINTHTSIDKFDQFLFQKSSLLGELA